MYSRNIIDDIKFSGFLFVKRALLIGMTCGMVTTAQAETVTIFPENPTNFEPIVARITNLFVCRHDPNVTQVKQVGTSIRIDLRAPEACTTFVPHPDDHKDVDFQLGQFPPGEFSVVFVETRSTIPGTTPQERLIGSAQFTVTDNNATKTEPFPLVDYTDHWWNPQESGMGFSIMQHPSDRIFASWFVYDQAGQPTWFTLQPGQWLSSTEYSGPMYKTTGTYLGATYDPSQLVVTPVGTGSFKFITIRAPRLSTQLKAKMVQKRLRAYPFKVNLA